MTTYIAFLRGINVSGANKISMADLRSLFERSGYKNVRTVLATGNIVFDARHQDADGLTQKLEDMIATQFGFRSSIMLRTLEQINALIQAEPFKGVEDTADTRLYVTFLGGRATQPDPGGIPQDENFRIVRATAEEICSVLVLTPERRTPELMDALGKAAGKNITTRSWNTIVKIAGSK